jgi:hypothetical protein
LIIISLILTFAQDVTKGYIIALVVIFAIILLVFLFIIWRQPQNSSIQSFKIPFVPFFPMISIFINIYLMMSLALYTWVRFFVWFAIGFAVYFFYGIRHSHENKTQFSWFPCIEADMSALIDQSEDVKLEETQMTQPIISPKVE